jgi:hypothetical protein
MTNQTNTAITAHGVTLASRIRVSPDVLLQEAGDETVLLDTVSERYFGLDRIGTQVWRLLAGGADLRSACDSLRAEYDVPAERLQRDVIALIGQLADVGLIAID